MLSLFGAGIGRGIVIGKAYVLRNSEIEIPHFDIDISDTKKEVIRLNTALKSTHDTYKSLLKNLPKTAAKESAAFIEAHTLMLRDPILINETKKIIRNDQVNAEYALQTQANNLIKVFEAMEDPYLRAKKEDVQHVTNRVLRKLLGIVSHSLDQFNEEDLKGRVIVARDLSPAETLFIKDRKLASFVTDLGSPISHTAVAARSLKLPAVVGLRGSTRYIDDEDTLIVDGMRGVIIVNPDRRVLAEFKALQHSIRKREKALELLSRQASKTSNGNRIQLLANVETAQELKEVKRVNAAGIGLYRTEYLFMNRKTLPSENEQFKAYKRIVTALDKSIVIRTLDIGGDKRLDFSYPDKASSESPLGLRAVRLCLNHVDIFKPQLRAILRASAYGKVSIMVPMVSNMDEVNQILSLIKQTKAELKREKIRYDKRIKIGAMIEVPAAAIMADLFAQKFDFLSIGTNDLIQYTLAIDRVDDAVNYLYEPIHPAVIQMIRHTIKAGERANIPVSLCGEMAGNVRYTKLLLGLGLKNFSMDATYILDVKEKIPKTDTSKLKYLVNKVRRADNPSLARDYLTRLNQS